MQQLPGHLFGESLRSCRLGHVELSERSYAPHFESPRHWHNEALFCLVLQGHYTEVYGNKVRECTPSTLLFHPPEEKHVQHFHETGGRTLVIEIEPGWMARLPADLVSLDQPLNFNGAAPEALGKKIYQEFTAMDAASPLIVEGLVLELLGETLRFKSTAAKGVAPRWLRQARELLDARFTEAMPLADVAQAVGVHPVHLAQTFRKFHRCTVGDYVRKLRIEHARQQLATSASPIVDIALAAGFCDQSHFSRTFKRLTGIAPSRYRESTRRAT